MDAELQDQLYQRYPAIFAERLLPATETAMCWGITIGNGWYQLIDGLCAQLQRETDRDGAAQVVAAQVKEKFGTLRFYAHDLSDRQSGMIALAIELSGRICDVCGAPGAPVNIQRMPATRCIAHAEGGRHQ
jgi:hypothetical protein